MCNERRPRMQRKVVQEVEKMPKVTRNQKKHGRQESLGRKSISVRGILILTRIHNILTINRKTMIHKDKDEHADNADSHRRTNTPDRGTIKRISKRDSSNSKPSIRENHRPPAKMEVLRRRPNNRNSSNTEEPKAQRPQERARCQRQYLQHPSISGSILTPHHAECLGKSLRHTDQSKRCEGWWSDADEHRWSVFPTGKSALHQPSDVV